MAKPWLRALITRHELDEQALAEAAQVDRGTVYSIVYGNLVTHAHHALALINAINQHAGTEYVLDDISPDSYYGGLVPGSMFEHGKVWEK